MNSEECGMRNSPNAELGMRNAEWKKGGGKGMTVLRPQTAASFRVFPGSLNPCSALVDTSGINTKRDKKSGTTDERR